MANDPLKGSSNWIMIRTILNKRAGMFGFMLQLLVILLFPPKVMAHASEQSFVLLLPTEIYSTIGVIIVLLTIILLFIIPEGFSHKFCSFSVPLFRFNFPAKYQNSLSLVSTLLFGFLIYSGLFGTNNPLTNLLPVFIWTIWWMIIFTLQGILGNIWSSLNPWSGFYNLFLRPYLPAPVLNLPQRWGSWPAIIAYICFVAFLLADPAPDQPVRLAIFAGGYWLYTMICLVLFGEKVWFERGECFTILFGILARISPLYLGENKLRLCFPCSRLIVDLQPTFSQSILVLVALATSSFDGLNETFWWLSTIGINPLEFPGRSAVILPTILGILGAILVLVVMFTACLWLGVWISRSLVSSGQSPNFVNIFPVLALSLFPIAFGYHMAHYFPSFLVNIQYAIVGLSDPFSVGANYFGLDSHFVTTGFFNTYYSVRAIWLFQGICIVFGHVLSVVICHVMVTRLFAGRKTILYTLIPISVLMILYTTLSLWLLSSPRGV